MKTTKPTGGCEIPCTIPELAAEPEEVCEFCGQDPMQCDCDGFTNHHLISKSVYAARKLARSHRLTLPGHQATAQTVDGKDGHR